jgi:hypothetical protein
MKEKGADEGSNSPFFSENITTSQPTSFYAIIAHTEVLF